MSDAETLKKLKADFERAKPAVDGQKPLSSKFTEPLGLDESTGKLVVESKTSNP